ncbi:hypothetical protein OCU04_010014 [Sclerotinia nivalis]|uniref:Uncharacterized protein n=1 Tax=Sclerotinia nivalis TaxID=352851 RepID=A0A9X0DFH4_9HELO|nr:hypothetical protein OCU04_010014 [Sclerotinia nivalis]
MELCPVSVGILTWLAGKPDIDELNLKNRLVTTGTMHETSLSGYSSGLVLLACWLDQETGPCKKPAFESHTEDDNVRHCKYCHLPYPTPDEINKLYCEDM